MNKSITLETSLAAKILGRKGGKATIRKYGKKQLKEWGKLGGRPRKVKEPLT